MTDDLVKRPDDKQDDLTLVYMWAYKMAENKYKARIEQLEAALEKARSIAKNGWITANCGTIGDADYGAELCEYIADQIAALGEKKDG